MIELFQTSLPKCSTQIFLDILTGAIAANAKKQSYSDAMKSTLFLLAGVSRSFVEYESLNETDLAIGYGFDGQEFAPQPYELYVSTPASSIDATPADSFSSLPTSMFAVILINYNSID